MTDVVGSAEFELRATRKRMKEDLAEAKRDLGGFVNDAEREVGEGANKISGSVGKIGLAVTAITAALGAGIALAIQFGGAALEMANNISSSAQRIGIGTSALQEWQYVARKTGEDANTVGSSLEAFSEKAAQAAAGLSKEARDAFHAIGLEPADLRAFKDTEQLLDATVDRIGELSSAADRAAIAEKLGLRPLATALRDGSDEVARLRDEAAALGFVLDDSLIQKGAAAQAQLEDLSQVIGIQMAEAFINLSDEVLTFTSHIADAIRSLNGFIEKIGSFRRNANAMYGDNFVEDLTGGNSFQALKSALGSVFSGRTASAASSIRHGDSIVDFSDELNPDAIAAFGRAPRSATRSGRTALTPVVPRGRSGPSGRTDRTAEMEARRAERVEQEIFRARQRLLGIADEEVLSAQQRFDLEQDRLKLEREARDAEIESKATRGELKGTERSRLEAANAEADAIEDRVLQDRAFRDIQNEQVAAQQLLLDFANERLSLEGAGAITEADRRRIEKEILDLRQKERRAALERAANDQTASPGERDAAVANLAMLPGMEAAENRSFDQGSTGGQMALDAVDGTRERAKWVEDAEAAYAEIDKLRADDLISEDESAQAKAKIYADLNEKRLASTSEFFGNLATLANSSNHTLAAIGKAAGIAQATIDGVVAIQKAWASAPFPYNLPAVAATTIATAANVATIAGVGFKAGGYTGSGSPDEVAGPVHRGEFVFDAGATSRIGVANLEAMRRGVGGDGSLALPALPGSGMPSLSGSSRSARPIVFDNRGAVMTSDLLAQMEHMAAGASDVTVLRSRSAAAADAARAERFRLGRNDE